MFLTVILAAALAAPLQSGSDLTDRLRELTELTRRIDAGDTTLIESRLKDKQPDRAMRSIRDLLHLDPSLKDAFLGFVRSGEVPEAARALAILALVQPSRQEVMLVYAALLEDPPSERLAQSVFAGFQRELRGDPASDEWMTNLLGLLPSMGKGYSLRTDTPMGLYLRSWDDFSFGRPPPGVSYRAFADSIVTFLEKDKFPALRYRLRMADQIFEETRYVGGVKGRFGKFLEKTYQEGKEAWVDALEVILRTRVYYGIERPMEVLGKGMSGLAPDQRVLVLGEVVRNSTIDAFRPPFAAYFDEAIELIGSEFDSKVARFRSNDTRILHCLIRQSLNDAWAERILIKHASVQLRRTGSEVVHRFMQSCDRFEANRLSVFLERMIKDPDGIVVGNAQAALQKALDRNPAVFEEVRAAELQKLLR